MGNNRKSIADNKSTANNGKYDPSLLLAWLLIILAYIDFIFIQSSAVQSSTSQG